MQFPRLLRDFAFWIYMYWGRTQYPRQAVQHPAVSTPFGGFCTLGQNNSYRIENAGGAECRILEITPTSAESRVFENAESRSTVSISPPAACLHAPTLPTRGQRSGQSAGQAKFHPSKHRGTAERERSTSYTSRGSEVGDRCRPTINHNHNLTYRRGHS